MIRSSGGVSNLAISIIASMLKRGWFDLNEDSFDFRDKSLVMIMEMVEEDHFQSVFFIPLTLEIARFENI